MKKTANKEIFESIQGELRKRLQDETFSNDNRLYFNVGDENSVPELDISIPKLRNKYNNLKKDWRKRVDRAKNGSGLRVEAEAVWFQILHPVMSDAHSTLDDLASQAQDTSFVQDHDETGNWSEAESDNEAMEDEEEIDEHVEQNSEDDETESEVNVSATAKDVSGGKNLEKKKKNLVIRPHEKRNKHRSQTQALGNLASGVNKMAEMQSKRLKLQEESENSRRAERESYLQFRREEAERNRQHELKLAEMYMRILAAPASAYQPPTSQPNYSTMMPDHQNQPSAWPNAHHSLPSSPRSLYTPPQVRQSQSDGSFTPTYDTNPRPDQDPWNPASE